MENGEIADFAMLLEFVHEIPGIERIRYTTSHPTEMTQRVIECYGKLPKLVSHLHLPVQSGSDRVLAAMKRGYTALEYKSILRKIRALRPDIAFSSDFIVGFPGETDEDFEKTMKLIEDVVYDVSFSFIFSPRPGTPAAEMVDETPHEVKLARLQRLQKRIEQQQYEISQKMVGTVQKILVDGYSKKHPELMTGRTENNKLVVFAGNPRMMNQIIPVTITEAKMHSLVAEVVIQGEEE
jgi:tRNA-2-methylthio-N6-dimethylallyladenosine synthase